MISDLSTRMRSISTIVVREALLYGRKSEDFQSTFPQDFQSFFPQDSFWHLINVCFIYFSQVRETDIVMPEQAR